MRYIDKHSPIRERIHVAKAMGIYIFDHGSDRRVLHRYMYCVWLFIQFGGNKPRIY